VLDRIRSLLDDVRVLTFEEDAAERFGIIQNQLLRQGITVRPVGRREIAQARAVA
jgi:predicted nucleic acid-binding protein